MKRFSALIGILLIIFLFQGCSKTSNKIETTNLSNILIDDIKIGSSIKDINWDMYTKDEETTSDHKYVYDEILIDEDEDQNVKYIFSRFDFNNTVISVNGNSKLRNIHQISEMLGRNFKDVSYDNSKGLRSHIYYDSVHNIKAEFIYVCYDNSLSAIKLQSLVK